jgi:hypothetical protein
MLRPAIRADHEAPPKAVFSALGLFHFCRFFRVAMDVKPYALWIHNSAKNAPQIAKTAAQFFPGEQMIAATNPFIL